MDGAARRAARILERVFAAVPEPVTFRLWDGSVVRAGAGGDAPFAVVFPTRRVFRRLLRRPTPYTFGLAFVDGDIDIEGDIFAAMSVGQYVEALRPSLGLRLAALAEVVRR